MDDQLFASFMLDEKSELEIALKAESVSEATPFDRSIKKLPASIDILEGIMPLRGDIIPVINMKKRLGLEEFCYVENAKVAVVNLYNQRFGLLFDDIKEVFKTDSEFIVPINSVLQSDDQIISAIISREQGARTAELLDLGHLFMDQADDIIDQISENTQEKETATTTTYSRWVVFSCLGQKYGVPIQYSREITFFSDIDETFRSDNVEGAIQLRGSTVPVLDGRFLLAEKSRDLVQNGDNRVLILSSDECSFGMMVDEIHTIITIPDNHILPVPSSGSENLQGIYPGEDGTNVLLLDMPNLVCNQISDIKSLARIKNKGEEDTVSRQTLNRSHHLITENCYLIFSIEKHFAIELKDVQEIIESENVLKVPRASGYSTAVINLRGSIVPIINLRHFYGYPETDSEGSKLIICKGHSSTIALEVDQIVTIYKQEDYHSTPSLNSQFSEKKDTVDRLIEFTKDNGLKEHVLVVNMHNLIRNHLEFRTNDKDAEESAHDHYDIESETINN